MGPLSDTDTQAATAAPIPATSIQPTPAPGLRGPKGLSPRQNFSRVNTGVPESTDAGAQEQKSIMPKVGSVMGISMATRPRLNDMLKVAMASAYSRAQVAEEARRQLQQLEPTHEEKTASVAAQLSDDDSIPTEYVNKLAAATDYMLDTLKEAAGPGEGAGTLSMGYTEASGDHALTANAGHASTIPAMTSPLQKARPQESSATQLENDMNSPAGAGDPPVSGSTKNAAPIGLIRKLAEELHTMDSSEAGPAASGKGRVPATAEGVAALTRRAAKSVPKAEMGRLLDEPMMSSAHDTVLQQTLSHTGESGAKIGSASSSRVAAATQLLRDLAGGN